MDNQRIVLAFNGHPASCAAVKWLSTVESGFSRMTASQIVALIVDVGQGDDPEELYGRALACGAHRVHVLDRCDAFARRVVAFAAESVAPLAPAGNDVSPITSPLAPAVSLDRTLRRLTYPVIAAALVEVATIEGADTVAHASSDPALDAVIAALGSSLRVLTPARDWSAQNIDVAEYLKSHRLSPGIAHHDRHLLMRHPAASASESDASVTIGFAAGVPRSVNGVAMELPELIESLSLIGGQYHVDDENGAPALVLLQQAYRECAGDGAATLKLGVVSAFRRTADSVIHA